MNTNQQWYYLNKQNFNLELYKYDYLIVCQLNSIENIFQNKNNKDYFIYEKFKTFMNRLFVDGLSQDNYLNIRYSYRYESNFIKDVIHLDRYERGPLFQYTKFWIKQYNYLINKDQESQEEQFINYLNMLIANIPYHDDYNDATRYNFETLILLAQDSKNKEEKNKLFFFKKISNITTY